jgi:16S rRNA (cytidine1402-2'-O)-methyltransferase
MATVYLIPSQLSEDGFQSIHPYTTDAIKKCDVLFTENERTTRRFLKQLWKQVLPGESIVIDDFTWHTIEDGPAMLHAFRQHLRENKTIGIVSEAGCPGVADPGQALVAIAQEMDVPVQPLVGPSAILLSLMASGLNGQQFQFTGYLPIENAQRIKAIKDLEAESGRKNCTQVFIETPYRNNQLVESLLKNCKPTTRLCIAVNITGARESIKTRTIDAWKKSPPDIHKIPAIFLLLA